MTRLLRALRWVVLRVLLLVLSIPLALVASELFLRVTYNPPSPYSSCGGAICLDPDYGLHLCPRYECTDIDSVLSNTGEDFPLVLNSLGMRDKEPVVPKPASEYRVMFLGDSYVVGGAVGDAETLPNQFKSIYQQAPVIPGRQLDVVNAGVSGFCTHQEVAWYEKVGHRLDPDLVFVVFNFNDVTGYMSRMTGRVRAGFELPEGVESIDKYWGFVVVKPFNTDAFFTTNSYLYQFYRFRMRPFFGWDPQLKHPEPMGTKDLWAYQGAGSLSGKLAGIEGDLRKLSNRLRQQGNRMAVILLPHESTVRDDEVDGVFFPDLRQMGKTLDIPMIDTLPALRRARQHGTKVYGNLLDGDLHLHANGLAIVAKLASDWLAANRPL